MKIFYLFYRLFIRQEKKFINIILCSVFIFTTLSCFGQEKDIRLIINLHDGNGPFDYVLPAMKWDENSFLFKKTFKKVKGIPENYKNVRKGIIYFDYNQYLFQSYISGTINQKQFNKIKKRNGFKINENKLDKNELKCFVLVILAINEKGDEVCLIDENNNFDFSDDSDFVPLDDTLSSKLLNENLRYVLVERVVEGVVIEEKAPVLFVKGVDVYSFSVAQYATTTFKEKNINYKLALAPIYFIFRTWTQPQLVLIKQDSTREDNSANKIINKGEYFKLGDVSYKFIGVDFSKNLLILQKAEINIEYSSQVGYLAPLFKNINLWTGEEISLRSFRGKYVLLDFWGTWCQPCIQQLPELKKWYSTIDTSKWSLISIASSDDIKKLNKMIAKENMDWPQILSDEITEQYQISSFPKFVLIDPDGIIIDRDLKIPDLNKKLD